MNIVIKMEDDSDSGGDVKNEGFVLAMPSSCVLSYRVSSHVLRYVTGSLITHCAVTESLVTYCCYRVTSHVLCCYRVTSHVLCCYRVTSHALCCYSVTNHVLCCYSH